MDLRFRIQYKQGPSNRAADALSRMNADENTVAAISVIQPTWLLILQEGYLEDSKAKTKLAELSVQSPDAKGYSLVNGIIKYQDRIWVGINAIAQRHILQALHSSALGGHSGVNATYQRVKSLFAWPWLKTSVTNYVQACQTCQ